MLNLPDARPLLVDHKIVPVVVIDDAQNAVPAGDALMAGGIHCAEITFRTEAASDAIASMSNLDSMVVGAGTILNAAQAHQAIDAGAQFLVSPGWSEEVAKVAIDENVPYLPGIQTATEVMSAVSFGATVVKYFPGGEECLKMIKALRGPFPDLLFMPSGGVKQDNLETWLAEPAIISVSGSWMIDRQMLAEKNFDGITEATRQATSLVKELGR